MHEITSKAHCLPSPHHAAHPETDGVGKCQDNTTQFLESFAFCMQFLLITSTSLSTICSYEFNTGYQLRKVLADTILLYWQRISKCVTTDKPQFKSMSTF